MKRMIILLAALMLLTLPALAEEGLTAEAALRSLYPAATILARAEDADDAFFVLEMGENQPKLCSFRLTEGAWGLTLDSDTAIRPDRIGDMYSQHLYDRVELHLDGDKLSIVHRYGSNIWWTYDFVREETGEWRFLRLYHADEGNRMYDELTLTDGCVSQTYTRKWRDAQEVSHTPPCPMPWLADCATLAGFDAAAFPMDLTALGDADLSRVTAELLPGYAYVDGKFSTYAATFLMDNPDGERVFLGGVYEDGWVWTESTPLPADTWCDSYHGGAGTLPIGFAHPDGLMSIWEDEEYPVYIEYNIVLQEDGRWLVEGVHKDNEEAFFFEEDGVYINLTGMIYGVSSLERDVTKIDWMDYPLCIGDMLLTLSRDWGVIGEPSLPLYADAEGTVVRAEYRYATPVHVLGYEGDLARVQIADSDVEGWMPAYGLFLGEDQIWEETEIDEDGEWTYWFTAEYDADCLVLPVSENIYRAPEGDILWTTNYETWLIFMADAGNGWAHVKFPDSLESGYVRFSDCLPEDE